MWSMRKVWCIFDLTFTYLSFHFLKLVPCLFLSLLSFVLCYFLNIVGFLYYWTLSKFFHWILSLCCFFAVDLLPYIFNVYDFFDTFPFLIFLFFLFLSLSHKIITPLPPHAIMTYFRVMRGNWATMFICLKMSLTLLSYPYIVSRSFF